MNVLRKLWMRPLVQNVYNGIVGATIWCSAHMMAAGILVWMIDVLSKNTGDPILLNAAEKLPLSSMFFPTAVLFWSLMFVVVMAAKLPIKMDVRKHYTQTKHWLDAFAQFPAWDEMMRQRPSTLHNIERCGHEAIPEAVRQQVRDQLLVMYPQLEKASVSKNKKWDGAFERCIQVLMAHVAHSRWFTMLLLISGLISASISTNVQEAMYLLSFFAVGKLIASYTVSSMDDLTFSVQDLDDALAVAPFDEDTARLLWDQMQSPRPNPSHLLDIKNSDIMHEYRIQKQKSQKSHATDVVEVMPQETVVSVQSSSSQLWSEDPALINTQEHKNDRYF